MLKVLFILLILSTSQVKAHPLTGDAQLLEIVDGDTIKIRLSETNAKIRLAGIDCFETSKIYRAYKQAYLNQLSIDEVILKGHEAKYYLKNLINTKNIKVEIVGIDKYGRLLGIIYTKDGLNINHLLIKNGTCSKYVYK